MALNKFASLSQIAAGTGISVVTSGAQLRIVNSSPSDGGGFPVNTVTLSDNVFKTLATVTFTANYGGLSYWWLCSARATFGGTTVQRVQGGYAQLVWGATAGASLSNSGNDNQFSNGGGLISRLHGVSAFASSAQIKIRLDYAPPSSGVVKEMNLKWQYIHQFNVT